VGQTCEISALTGDLETKMRLVNLGFHTHSLVKLLMLRGSNLVVCVDGSRFAIGEELAERIRVVIRS
jgi:ferrous iron transport protein A